jgi:hypothetical protein
MATRLPHHFAAPQAQEFVIRAASKKRIYHNISGRCLIGAGNFPVTLRHQSKPYRVWVVIS